VASRLRDADGGWTPAAGESLRLVANELADVRQRVATLEASRDVAASVSGMVQRGLALRLDSVTIERDTLHRKVSTLEEQLAERDKQLKEKEQELERIRKIIRN
jgi:vacuolar-type H+-ATPase subunit I/STV1